MESSSRSLQTDEGCIIRPFMGFCVVLRHGAKDKVGSIIIPTVAQRRPTIGKVVRVGDPDHTDLLDKIVVFPHMSGISVSIKGKPEYIVFRYEELLGVVESENPELEEE